ncbi:hypothetical protein [Rhizobium sp. IBUN]|uniref:hypothetical protein n=1 Tax=Rhizobium sp. IBUN TaxID=1042326 RepID=UPI00041C3FAB|nr:hypothetical protein [Rhizobium sp. IBUN]
MCRRTKLISISLGLALGAASVAHAGCTDYGNGDSTCYDWQSGNRYSIHRDDNGDMTMRGSNLGTGSTWRQTYDADTGRTRGYDSDGNFWSCSKSGVCY